MKVFFGGSKRISDIGTVILDILEAAMKRGDEILVGDCPGADARIQRYLAQSGYREVTVYCSGDEPRFNIGEWDVRTVVLDPGLTHGFAFWRQKDIQMEFDCDRAVMVWDGKSRGTWQNIVELTALGKECEIILKDEDGCWSIEELRRILCDAPVSIRRMREPDTCGNCAVTSMFAIEAGKRNILFREIHTGQMPDIRAGFGEDSDLEALLENLGFDSEYCIQERKRETTGLKN